MVLGRVLNAAIGLTPDGPHLSHLSLGRVLKTLENYSILVKWKQETSLHIWCINFTQLSRFVWTYTTINFFKNLIFSPRVCVKNT